MKKKWNAGKITAVILGSTAAVIVLCVSFVISVFQLLAVVSNMEERYSADIYEAYQEQEEKSGEENDEGNLERESDYPKEASGNAEEYYDFENSLRDDLKYNIEFKTSLCNDFDLGEDKGSAKVEFHYPVVMGNVKNLDGINQAIQEEIHIVEEHVSYSAQYLTKDEIYSFSGEGYVTYMSEDILSVVYVEYGYLNGSYLESYVVSYNIDMQTGMVMNNTHLLAIDDKFSIDFRERCEEQNGAVDSLYYLSDQEITAYLTDEDYLIIFYTPLGMEVGFNFYDGWVTVTYKDYEKYQKQF